MANIDTEFIEKVKESASDNIGKIIHDIDGLNISLKNYQIEIKKTSDAYEEVVKDYKALMLDYTTSNSNKNIIADTQQITKKILELNTTISSIKKVVGSFTMNIVTFNKNANNIRLIDLLDEMQQKNKVIINELTKKTTT